MTRSAIHCEVLVIGGGPAGALIASILARSGVDVIQVVAAPTQKERPYEVLGPSTRRLLAHHKLPEPVCGTATCKGVLSRWGASDLEFHDYMLTACSPALAVDRTAFHDSLVLATRAAGVRVQTQARVKSGQALWQTMRMIEVSSDGLSSWVSASWVVDATGRLGSPCAPPQVHRKHFDRLVALSTPFDTTPNQDCLLVEAVREGWWYVPPSIDGKSQVVFLTDVDLLPRGSIERREWLRQRYRSSELIQDVASVAPLFLDVKGTDARFSCISDVACDQWVAAGDTALALDPLSGNGTWVALTGAEHVASEFCDRREVGARYASWWRQTFERERAMRAEVHYRASRRFPDAAFWQRRFASA